MTTTTDAGSTVTATTTPVAPTGTPDSPSTVDASHALGTRRLTARRAGWTLAGIVGVAAVTAAIVVGGRTTETAPDTRTPSLSDSAEWAHDGGAAGAALSTAARPLTAGDSMSLAHGQTGSVTTASGVRVHAPQELLTPGRDATELAHGTRGGLSDAAGAALPR